MSGLLFLLLLLSSTATIDSKCIGTFKELEKEIISNDENLHSLLKAFFPTNQYPGVWVEIQYYINSTDDDGNGTIPVHPLALLLSNSNISYSPDYTFYWASSAVFIYFDYRFIQGLSFYLLSFEPHFAYIVIPEFCSNINNNTIMELINDVTTWMKSYAVNGQFSFKGVIDNRLQGYSYSDIIIIDDDIYSFILFVYLLLIFFCSFPVGFYLIDNHSNEVSKMCKQPKKKQQRFRFKSIFCATIITIFGLNVVVQISWLIFFLNLDNSWSERSLSSNIIIYGISFVLWSSILINLGKGFTSTVSHFGFKCSRIGIFSFFGQVHAVWTVATMTTTLPALLFGLMLGFLISPEQIFVAILLVLIGSLTVGIFLTFYIDKLIDSGHVNCQLFSLVIYGFAFVSSIIMSITIYVYALHFSDIGYKGKVDTAGQLFMTALLSFIVYMISKEYDKFITDEKENHETNGEMTNEVPNPSPGSGIASTNNGGTNEETPLLHTQ
jgi:hypothetical protein